MLVFNTRKKKGGKKKEGCQGNWGRWKKKGEKGRKGGVHARSARRSRVKKTPKREGGGKKKEDLICSVL